MGKQRRERKKLHKENPTGLLSVKDFENIEAENPVTEDRETALQRVYEEIQSANVEEKLSGLQTLETMSCNPGFALQVAQEGIAKIIGPMLLDPNVHVRAGSASALRHIVENGKSEAHISLLKDDIMTPLCNLISKYYQEWELDQNKKTKAIYEKETFVQVITLLWTLCESNDNAIKHCNDEGLVPMLTKFFDIDTYGRDIVTVTVQCLLSLSEDNAAAIRELRKYESSLLQLLAIQSNPEILGEMVCLKTAVTALLMNICDSVDSLNVICKGITVLSETLSFTSETIMSILMTTIEKCQPCEKYVFSEDHKKGIQEGRSLFGAQQQALEILANLCTEEQNNENDSDLESSDYEDDGIDDVCMDDKLCTINTSLPLEIIEAFNSCDIIKKIWDKTTVGNKNTVELLKKNDEGKVVLQQIHTLKCRAYLCLNNLVSCLEIDALGGVEELYRMWLNIGTFVFHDADPSDTELLEAATAAMRAILQRLSEVKPSIFNQLLAEDLQPMLNGERQCENDNVRANLIRILGNIALILISNGATETRELVKQITIFLLETAITESKAWVTAECLDAIMDIYAEDETDQLAIEIGLVGKLQALVSVFKNKVRQQKKTLGDNTVIVSTVNANIMRFIKYKEKRMTNM